LVNLPPGKGFHQISGLLRCPTVVGSVTCSAADFFDLTGNVAEIASLFNAINAENKLLFAANDPIVSAGGAEIVHP
jgi:hypothetical protein